MGVGLLLGCCTWFSVMTAYSANLRAMRCSLSFEMLQDEASDKVRDEGVRCLDSMGDAIRRAPTD